MSHSNYGSGNGKGFGCGDLAGSGNGSFFEKSGYKGLLCDNGSGYGCGNENSGDSRGRGYGWGGISSGDADNTGYGCGLSRSRGSIDGDGNGAGDYRHAQQGTEQR